MNPFRKLMQAINTVADAFFGLAEAVTSVTVQIESRFEGLEKEPEVIEVPVTNGKQGRKRITRKR
jgi:hypothetical protein